VSDTNKKVRSVAWVEAHNAEACAIWEAFYAGRPRRPPVGLGINARFFIFNEEFNPGEQLTFEDCLLQRTTLQEVRAETERILNSGICVCRDDTRGRFVLREGSNLAPETPQANASRDERLRPCTKWPEPGPTSS
jgi:hypothetical protein